MYFRAHDGLNLATALGLLTLGLVVVYYTTGDREPGNLFFPLPTEPPWLAHLMATQQQPAFGVLVAAVGAGLLWYAIGGPLPSWLRVVLLWATLALLWDLLLYRAMGFWTARNPPWWAVVWLTGLTVACTVRRIGDLRNTWLACRTG